jgi:hypothetical protein
MFIVRLHVRSQTAPVELPGWPDVFTAAVVRDILRSGPRVLEAEVVEADAPRDLFPNPDETDAGKHPPGRP